MGKQVFCDICNCYIPSAALVAGHKDGRKHQRLLNIKKEKQQSEACSIYVRGFPKSKTIEKDLGDILKIYGTIHGIYVDKTNLDFAIVQFGSEESVQKVLENKNNILLDGKKMIIKKKTGKRKEEGDENKDSQLCHTNQFLSEKNFGVDVLMHIKKEKTVEDQIRTLVSESSLSHSDIEMRKLVCTLLTEVFVEVYPDAKVEIFGSSAYGVGTKGCDLDVTLITDCLSSYAFKGPHGRETKPNDDVLNRNLVLTTDFVSAEKTGTDYLEVLSTKEKKEVPEIKYQGTCSDRFPPFEEKSQAEETTETVKADVDVITEILRKFGPGCKHVFPLKSARCPLVNFSHSDSGLKVDLSINNRLAVENTALMQAYINSDQRVHSLIFIIRAWAKSRGLYGKGGKQLTGYALALLIIRYLQQCDPPVLPCLQCLLPNLPQPGTAEGDSSRLSNIIDGWECYFQKQPSWKSMNTATEGELLKNFFHYWKEFDFTKEIVSIGDLAPLTKASLSSPSTSEEKHTFKMNALCIEDPFELNHNLTQNVTVPGLENWKAELNAGYDITSRFFREKIVEKSSDETGNPGTSLLDLLEPVGLPRQPNPKSRRKRLAVKHIFDILSSSGITCESCAKAANEILQFDLRMQCEFKLVPEIESQPNDEKTKDFQCHKDNVVECKVESMEDLPIPSPDSNNTDESSHYVEPLAKRRKIETPMSHQLLDGDVVNEKGVVTTDKCDLVDLSKDLSVPEFQMAADAIEITAKAWANTWVKRRQQRRLLQSPNKKATDCVRDEADNVSETSNTRSESTSMDFISSSATRASLESSSDVSKDGLEHIHETHSNNKSNVTCSMTTNSNALLSISIKFANMQGKIPGVSTRVIVKVIDACDLNIFHTFFAYFKKRLIAKLNLNSDYVVTSMKR